MKKILFVCLAAVLLAVSCATQHKALWQQTDQQGSREAYLDYVEKYPNSPYARNAYDKIVEIDFSEAQTKNTVSAYETFLTNYPDSRFTSTAKEAMAELAYNSLGETPSSEQLQEFARNFPDSKYTQRLNEKLAAIAYKEAEQKDTKDAYEAFLRKYPGTRYSQDVRDRLALAAYNHAIEQNSTAAYKQFIRDFPNTSLSKDIEKRLSALDPSIDFSPEKFFSFVLKNPGSPDISAWTEAYDQYYYGKGRDKSYDPMEEFALYTTLNPDSKYNNKIFDRVFKSEPSYGFDGDVNFVLFDEYAKRFPAGKYNSSVTLETLLKNEYGYLKKIYLSGPAEKVLAKAKARGATGSQMKDIQGLLSEIKAFENLDITDENACTVFINTYTKCPFSNTIRNYHFDLYRTKYYSTYDSQFVKPMIQWVTYKGSEQFYKDVWASLTTKTSGKTEKEQIEILSPWLLADNYRYVSMEEKVFLSDILSWASVLHINENQPYRAALANFTSSAVLHTVFNELSAKLLSNMFDGIDFSNINRWKALQQQRLQEAKVCKANIRSGRDLLYNLGVVSYTFGSLDIFSELAKLQSSDEEVKKQAEKSAKEKIQSYLAKEDPYRKVYINFLLNLFKEDSDCWPALRAFTYFPDKRALEPIVSMPRFYDYESNLEEFLDKFEEESIELAKKWLTDSKTTAFQKGRAFYILGYHKKKIPVSVKKSDLDSYGYYYDYYKLRTNASPGKQYLDGLIESASSKNKIALVLYSRVRGGTRTPEKLKNWVISKIDEKKYDDNQALHIYRGIIEGLSAKDKETVVDKMYNSYNYEWKDLASSFYSNMLPGLINKAYVTQVIRGSVPWKKTDLVKYIAKNELTEYNDLVAEYLRGKAYTDGDSKLIHRNLENMFTKDVVLGYNQRMNWSAVRSAVNKAEPTYMALLISGASDALKLLDYNEAVSIIKDRFLTDDFLCIQGARWITQNFDSASHQMPAFLDVSPKTDLQEATLAFLNARFSQEQDYKKYVKQTSRLKQDSSWPQLVSLGVEHVGEGTFNDDETSIVNPVDDFSLKNLTNNIKTRYLTILTKAKQ